MDQLGRYEAEHDYQVINDQGTSCLGFCEDMASAMDLEYELPMGDLTLTGNMKFPTAPFFVERTEEATPTDLLFFLVETPTLPLSNGTKWPPRHLQDAK